MNITVEIKAPELAKAILVLAQSLEGAKIGELAKPAQEQKATEQAPVQQAPVPPAQQAPVQEQQPQAVPTAPQQAPVEQQAPQAVPTSAATYTMEQLAVAATQLVDAGKREDLIQLLASFGAQALTALPKEQYGAFATKLREMGAKI